VKCSKKKANQTACKHTFCSEILKKARRKAVLCEVNQCFGETKRRETLSWQMLCGGNYFSASDLAILHALTLFIRHRRDDFCVDVCVFCSLLCCNLLQLKRIRLLTRQSLIIHIGSTPLTMSARDKIG